MEPDDIGIPAGHSYLFKKGGSSAAFDIFKRFLVSGRRGIILSRLPPEKIPILYEVECPSIWIVSRPPSKGSVMTVDPQRLTRVYSLIGDFVRNNPGSVALLDGLNYLLSENDFSSVMKTVQLINEAIAMTRSILLVPIDPKGFSDTELGFLEREIPPFEMDFYAMELLRGDNIF